MSAMNGHAWFRGELDGTRPVRVLCAPHAGGGASAFNSWAVRLGNDADVVRLQLPGREDRVQEAPRRELTALLEELAPAVESLLTDRPLVLYGHSLGALIAYALARHLEAVGKPPAAVLVSSRRAPQTPLLRAPTCDLPDAEFTNYILGLGGATTRLMENARWREYFVPTMRADLAVTDLYRHPGGPRVSAPLHAYVGKDDPIVPEVEMRSWAEQAGGPFHFRKVPGGHFLTEDGVALILADILEHVRSAARGARP